MDLNIKKEQYKKNGFLVLNNIFDLKFVELIKNEILNLKNVITYYDRNGELRRVEKLYDKGNQLFILNNKISFLLNSIFDEEFIIFKDKFNLKPPNGEGFHAHYDGIFKWIDENNTPRNGWYEYSNFFVNVLVALDKCDHANGALQISDINDESFDNLLKKTYNDGSPNILKEIESNLIFQTPILKPGDVIIFSNKCPHRSFKNKSHNSRMTLYYTYHPKKDGDNYEKYFTDKGISKNINKSLTGDI